MPIGAPSFQVHVVLTSWSIGTTFVVESAWETAIVNATRQTSIGRYRRDGIYLGFAAEKARIDQRQIMRYTTLTALGLFLCAATVIGQQPSGRVSAITQQDRRAESDSAFIAREWAVWNAIKDADSAAIVRALGSGPSLTFVGPGGVSHTSVASWAGQMTKCDTRTNKLDMFNVLRPNDDTTILIYRVALARAVTVTLLRSSKWRRPYGCAGTVDGRLSYRVSPR